MVGNEVPEKGGYHAGQGHWFLLCARGELLESLEPRSDLI